jgi:hypothetical protein
VPWEEYGKNSCLIKEGEEKGKRRELKKEKEKRNIIIIYYTLSLIQRRCFSCMGVQGTGVWGVY